MAVQQEAVQFWTRSGRERTVHKSMLPNFFRWGGRWRFVFRWESSGSSAVRLMRKYLPDRLPEPSGPQRVHQLHQMPRGLHQVTYLSLPGMPSRDRKRIAAAQGTPFDFCKLGTGRIGLRQMPLRPQRGELQSAALDRARESSITPRPAMFSTENTRMPAAAPATRRSISFRQRAHC